MFAATLVNRSGTMAVPFLTLYLTTALHFSSQQAASMLAAFGAGALLGSPIAGRICDRVGASPIMIASLVSTGTLLLLFPLFKSVAAVGVMAFVLAFTMEMFRPANQIALSMLAGSRRREVFALSRLAANLGMSIGPAIGGVLATVSFNSIFIVDGLTTVAAALVLIVWMLRGGLVRGERTHGTARDEPTPAVAPHRSPRLLLFLLGVFLVACIFFQCDSSLPLFAVRHLGMSSSVYGLVFPVNTVLVILFELPLTTATSHWPYARTLAIGAFLLSVGFGALAFTHSAWLLLSTVVVWTVGEMLLFASMTTFVADIAPRNRMGEYMGLYNTAFGAALPLGSYVGVRVLESLGPTVLWGGVAVCGFVAILLFYMTTRTVQLKHHA